MRIAVCLSGQPRFLDNGYQQIFEKIISKYNDVDFFIHTWWNDDELNAKGANRNYTFNVDTLKIIMDYYKPRIILNEPQMNFNIYKDVDYETINPISPYSMFYSIKIANDLKSYYENKNNFKYDVVIRCRFDISIENFDINLSEIDLSYIYTDTVGNDFPNDQLAISSSENMDYYSSLYDKINDYYNEGFRNFVGERLLRHHLKDSKLLFTDKIKNDIIKND
jgi:hypothetical protein